MAGGSMGDKYAFGLSGVRVALGGIQISNKMGTGIGLFRPFWLGEVA